MKRIVLAGLTRYENYGDQFIYRSLSYLLSNMNEQIEILELDFESTRSSANSLTSRLLHKAARVFNSADLELKSLKRKHRKAYEAVISKADGIIFACGSFKYGTQKLWAYYSLVIDIAKKHHVPVMFDAMNVQKFDGNNRKCMILKQHLNEPIVTWFTSRDGEDGVKRLRESYVTNPLLKTAAAGDPAFHLSEVFQNITPKKRDVIGVNLLKGENFRKYGKKMSEEEVADCYGIFLKHLEEDGIPYELFTNGLKSDREFGEKIVRKYDLKYPQIIVPQSAEDLVRIITSYRAILGGRLHACICAYAFDIPLVSFLWDDKMLYFAKMAKWEPYFLAEEEFNGDRLYETLKSVMNKEYDKENREYWKKETRRTLREFMDSI